MVTHKELVRKRIVREFLPKRRLSIACPLSVFRPLSVTKCVQWFAQALGGVVFEY